MGPPSGNPTVCPFFRTAFFPKASAAGQRIDTGADERGAMGRQGEHLLHAKRGALRGAFWRRPSSWWDLGLISSKKLGQIMGRETCMVYELTTMYS